jgi:peptide/nickel transport system substrate-binding protein
MFRTHARDARRRPLLIALTLALALGALAATAAPASAASVDKTAILKFGVPIEENGGVYFDPANTGQTGNPTGRIWQDLIYDTMIHNTPDGKGAPGLATKWTTPDPSTVELTLRDGVKFSDGTPFNAAAVKGAWDRTLAAPRPNVTPEIQAVASIEAVNDNTIRIHLKQPIAKQFIDSELKSTVSLAVPSPASIAAGTANTKPVGAGPYLLDSYTTGKLVLKKNPTFYDPKQQKLAGIEFDNMTQGPPAVGALQAGAVDLIWSIPPDSIETLKSAGFVVDSVPSDRAYTLGLCTTQGIFQSKEARQALQYAINRDDINSGALAGTGAPSISPVPPTSEFFDKTAVKGIKYNPKKAKALLKQAGIAPGTKVNALIPAQPPYNTIGEVVQSQLKDVGLDMQITNTTNFVADAARLKPDLMVASVDPSLFSLVFSGTESPLNPCGNKNDTIANALVATRDASKSPADVAAAYKTLQETAVDESPVIVTNLQGLLAAHTKQVQGVDIINSPYGPQLNTIYKTSGN